MDVFASALRGMKRSTYPMIITLVFCTVFRILFLETLFNLEFFHNVGWLYAVFPISWVFSIIGNGIGVIRSAPKVFKQIDEDKTKKETAVLEPAKT